MYLRLFEKRQYLPMLCYLCSLNGINEPNNARSFFGLVVFFSLLSKKLFRSKNIQLSSLSFFLFPETPHEAHICSAESLVACIIPMPRVSLLLGSQSWWVQISLTFFFHIFRRTLTQYYF